MKSKKTIKETIKETVDLETGEVSSRFTLLEFSKISEPPYVKMYLQDLGLFYNLPKTCMNILATLVRRMDYDGYVSLGINGKRRMLEEFGTKSIQVIDNNISTLKKKGILKSIGRGEYILNPNLFAKGDWKDIYKRRKEFIELTVRYNANGTRTIKSKVV